MLLAQGQSGSNEFSALRSDGSALFKADVAHQLAQSLFPKDRSFKIPAECAQVVLRRPASRLILHLVLFRFRERLGAIIAVAALRVQAASWNILTKPGQVKSRRVMANLRHARLATSIQPLSPR